MSNKLSRYKGDTYSIEATLTKDNIGVDFTAGNTATFSFARGDVYVTIDGINGTVDGTISFPFPGDVKAGKYSYDIQVVSPTGEVRTYVKDILDIVDDVTK